MGFGLEVDRALTQDERRRLLNAAEWLPMIGGRSKDRRHYKKIERPWHEFSALAQPHHSLHFDRNRDALFCRTRFDLAGFDFDKRILQVREKGGYFHGYKINQQGLTGLRITLEKCSRR